MAVYKITPTKTNLIKSKNSLEFAKKGYELLDRKRTVLIREMMSLIDKASMLQKQIETEFENAYRELRFINITMGEDHVSELAKSLGKEEDFNIQYRSVMGIEFPTIRRENTELTAEYGIYRTNADFDKAVETFQSVKGTIYELAEIENSVYKLVMEIKKTQKRANALDKIQIPLYEKTIKYIDEVLEEKGREDFFRLKKIKSKY